MFPEWAMSILPRLHEMASHLLEDHQDALRRDGRKDGQQHFKRSRKRWNKTLASRKIKNKKVIASILLLFSSFHLIHNLYIQFEQSLFLLFLLVPSSEYPQIIGNYSISYLFSEMTFFLLFPIKHSSKIWQSIKAEEHCCSKLISYQKCFWSKTLYVWI